MPRSPNRADYVGLVIDPSLISASSNACLIHDGPNTRSTWRFKARTYPGEHRWPVLFCNQQKRLHGGLPIFGIVFCFGQFNDEMCGIAERDQRFPARWPGTARSSTAAGR
jgi:hypothetical protein